MKARKWLPVLFTGVITYLALCAVVGILVAKAAIQPARQILSAPDESAAPTWAREDDDANLADVAIVAGDGVSLSAWEVRPDEWNGSAVILLHGLRGNRLEMVNYADIFLNHGYSVLMPDARGHGNSGGAIATYGLIERDDIRRWFEWLAAKQHPQCIYGFGESMGAGQLLQSLQVEPHFCAVAAECPFSSLRESFYDRIGQEFHTGPWLGRTLFQPIVTSARVYVRLRYRLDIDDASPEEAVAATSIPVLLIHGQTDSNIPARHSRRIAARNPRVMLWEVPNTGHSNAIDTSPAELERRLISWFAAHPNATNH